MLQTTPIIFILSWNRPIYLWACLDSFYRATRSPCRFVIADNASSDPLNRHVIEGFRRRGMFHAVHLCEENDPFRFKWLIERYWNDIGDSFVFVESDTAVVDPGRCWLKIMREHLAPGHVAAIGSRVEQGDFVDRQAARVLEPQMPPEELDFLIKTNAPMRKYEHTDAPLVEPHNPPLRLLMMKKSAYAGIEFGDDTSMYRQLRAQGWHCPISTEVAHRHLSLLNIYDYPDYSRALRDDFFQPVKNREN
jgi:hypothetical protein